MAGTVPGGPMKIGITCYPTYGGSGVVATELGIELAARGHEIHFISYAMPIRLSSTHERIHFHEVEVTSYPLFDHPPYTLALATKMLEVAEQAAAGLVACALRDSALGERVAGAHDGAAEKAAVYHHSARHGHHPSGQRPQLFAHHAVFDRAERWRDLHLKLSARTHHSRIRNQAAHRSDSQLRQLRPVHALRRPVRAANNGPNTTSRS